VSSTPALLGVCQSKLVVDPALSTVEKVVNVVVSVIVAIT
jgi:hypothetical protein